MEYNKVCLAILSFIADLSANYLHLSKDRLVFSSTDDGRKKVI
jgi:isoleucyl-tRNA synthetase